MSFIQNSSISQDKRRYRWVLGTIGLMSALVLGACKPKPEGAGPGGPGGPGGGPPPPTEVTVLTVTPKAVTLTQDLPGRISALRMAEVRARVNGIVLKRLFKEGTDVTEGQLLYEIDPAPYQAALESAQGTLARAEANAEVARVREERLKKLIDSKAISKQDYDDAVAAQRASQAEVLTSQAAMETAKINLGYTKVISPVAGRIGLSQVTEGAYVQAATATLLATVQQIDRVYVDVTQPSSDLLRLKHDLAEGRLKKDEAGQAKVKLVMEDGGIYPEEGTLEVSDVTVDANTNSVLIRAIFPNPRRDLLPGLYVRARLQEGSSPNAILVPQYAVTRNTKGQPTTLVVGANDHAELRVLETPRTVGNEWLVASGLKAGDRVITTNLQRIRPGASVKVVELPAGAPEAGGAPATAKATGKPGAEGKQ
jgi:membrane fusion protein (multidrug efflux system)